MHKNPIKLQYWKWGKKRNNEGKWKEQNIQIKVNTFSDALSSRYGGCSEWGGVSLFFFSFSTYCGWEFPWIESRSGWHRLLWRTQALKQILVFNKKALVVLISSHYPWSLRNVEHFINSYSIIHFWAFTLNTLTLRYLTGTQIKDTTFFSLAAGWKCNIMKKI